MKSLIHDVQITILSYLEPNDIRILYSSCQQMLSELSNHKGFVVHCKNIVKQEIIDWFHEKNIKLQLFEKYVLSPNGDYCYFLNGQLHRENDLPALKIGLKFFWYQHDQLHRDNDQPACIEFDDENKTQIKLQCWCQHGELHRDNDLPARIWSDGVQMWFKNGLIHRDRDQPAYIAFGDQYWYQHDERHRDNDLPASIYHNGDQMWYQHGIKHRNGDQPAVIFANGDQQWYCHGNLIKWKNAE